MPNNKPHRVCWKYWVTNNPSYSYQKWKALRNAEGLFVKGIGLPVFTTAISFPFVVLPFVVANPAQVWPVEVETVIMSFPVQITLRAAVIKSSIGILLHYKTRWWRYNKSNVVVITGRRWRFRGAALAGFFFLGRPNPAGLATGKNDRQRHGGKGWQNKCSLHWVWFLMNKWEQMFGNGLV